MGFGTFNMAKKDEMRNDKREGGGGGGIHLTNVWITRFFILIFVHFIF